MVSGLSPCPSFWKDPLGSFSCGLGRTPSPVADVVVGYDVVAWGIEACEEECGQLISDAGSFLGRGTDEGAGSGQGTTTTVAGDTRITVDTSKIIPVDKLPESWSPTGRVAIIGENMVKRVYPFARILESQGFQVETFSRTEGLSEPAALDENGQWIRNLINEKVPILDIGPEIGRPMYPGPSSPFYARELQEVQGYWNYWRILWP